MTADKAPDELLPGAADPWAAFDAVVVDLTHGRWTAAAARCDPAWLMIFHRELGEALDAALDGHDAFERATLPAVDEVDPDVYDAAYAEAQEIPPRFVPGRGAADCARADARALAQALGASSSAELEVRPPFRAFARWLDRACPARRAVADAERRQLGRPSDAAPWHRVRRVGLLPDAHPDVIHLAYHLDLGGVPPDATARRVRAATCRRSSGGAWRLAAAPDFPGADYPLVPVTALNALAAQYAAASAAGDLVQLAAMEDVLATEAFYLKGSPRVRERERNVRRLYARYAVIFRAYAERFENDSTGLEALKRAAFLSWRAATGLSERTLLPDLPEGDVAAVWNWVLGLIERDELDAEWTAMLGWYYRTAPAFFDHLEALLPWDGARLRAAVAALEGVPRVDRVATTGRGALGRYFAALAGGPVA